MKNQTIAIIGFGRFGQLLADILHTQTNHDLIIITSKKMTPWSKRTRFTSDFTFLKKAEVIFPCVPIRHFKSTLEKMVHHIKKNVTVIDVCSVKILPTQVMLKLLPTGCTLIASHPMFGTASLEANKGFQGLKWVFWNVRGDKKTFQDWHQLFTMLGFSLVELNPATHDRLVARSQVFTQIVGILMDKLHLEDTPINTVWFESLLKIKAVVISQNPELIEDMLHANPFSQVLLDDISHEIQLLSSHGFQSTNTIQ